jgi:Tol biopolymer transport system component
LPTYERMVERFKTNPNRASSTDLAEAIRWIEETKGATYAPGDFVIASPDGKHAVIKGRYRPLLLIDIGTLNTHRLLDKGDETPPIAWTADSRYLAFAPSLLPGELHVYDLEQKTASVVTRDAPSWITALSWSPDGQRIAAFGLRNRRMVKNPLALVAATAGHPIFKNDGVLFVYRLGGGDSGAGFSVPLKRGISEQSGPEVRIEWK